MRIIVDKSLYAKIHNYSKKVCKKHLSLIDDVTQETAIGVHGKEVTNTSSYLYSSCVGNLRKILAKQKKEKENICYNDDKHAIEPVQDVLYQEKQIIEKIVAYKTTMKGIVQRRVLEHLMMCEDKFKDMQIDLGFKSYNTTKANYRHVIKVHGKQLRKLITQ